MKYTEMQKNVIYAIRDFYLDRHMAIAQENISNMGLMTKEVKELTKKDRQDIQFEHDNAYSDANKEIYALMITRVDIDENYVVTITLHRPGLLVGNKGVNIEALRNYLKKNVSEQITIKIVEDHLNDYLIACDYLADNDDYYEV